MRGAFGWSTIASTFARSFLIQGSWNYHTMLGSGFAFAMLPGLRRLFGSDAERMEESVVRHLEHFNAHPYLSNVALGAALRLEADGADAETVRRFKLAVRGPLGSLGDSLVWATWLPGVAMGSLALFWFGLPGWMSAVMFLVVYNVGHLGLRAWGLHVGLSAGRDVGRLLGEVNLTRWTARLQPGLVVLLGVLSGAVLSGRGGLVESGAMWTVLAVIGFVAGDKIGHPAWRPAAIATVGVVSLLAAWGVLT